jgi:hypothetical protein
MLAEWPILLVGFTFTLIGALKWYGLRRGMVGGVGKRPVERLCGT